MDTVNTTLFLTAVIAGATVVTAFATVKYTKATTRLWGVTRDSVEAMRWATYGGTLHQIVMNHREIAFKALESPELLKAFMAGPSDLVKQAEEPLTAEKRIFASALINHAEACYQHQRFRTVPPEFRQPLLQDIENLFGVPFVRKRWPEVRMFLEAEFVKYVDGILAQPRRGGGHEDRVQ